MPQATSPQEFVAKRKGSTVAERAGAQEHFIHFCRLLGQPTSAEVETAGLVSLVLLGIVLVL